MTKEFLMQFARGFAWVALVVWIITIGEIEFVVNSKSLHLFGLAYIGVFFILIMYVVIMAREPKENDVTVFFISIGLFPVLCFTIVSILALRASLTIYPDYFDSKWYNMGNPTPPTDWIAPLVASFCGVYLILMVPVLYGYFKRD